MLLNLPNILTLTNLLFGCAALLFLINGDYQIMLYCMLGSAIADLFDGLAARALKIQSDLGKELDSIADMVSFGLIPGAIAYVLLLASFQAEPSLPQQMVWDWRAFPGFLVTAFSGLRLAKFNLDTRQSDSFLGLPTPSATFFVLGLLMIASQNFQGWNSWLLQPWMLLILFAAICFLLISELPLFSLKMKKLSWAGNELQIIFAIVSIALLIILREVSFSFIILLYVLVGLGLALFRSSSTQKN